MTGKVIKWNYHHRDFYVSAEGHWIKVLCTLPTDSGLHCTTPTEQPRGYDFDYNFSRYGEAAMEMEMRLEAYLQQR